MLSKHPCFHQTRASKPTSSGVRASWAHSRRCLSHQQESQGQERRIDLQARLRCAQCVHTSFGGRSLFVALGGGRSHFTLRQRQRCPELRAGCDMAHLRERHAKRTVSLSIHTPHLEPVTHRHKTLLSAVVSSTKIKNHLMLIPKFNSRLCLDFFGLSSSPSAAFFLFLFPLPLGVPSRPSDSSSR